LEAGIEAVRNLKFYINLLTVLSPIDQTKKTLLSHVDFVKYIWNLESARPEAILTVPVIVRAFYAR
jgi:hypothetical protein